MQTQMDIKTVDVPNLTKWDTLTDFFFDKQQLQFIQRELN